MVKNEFLLLAFVLLLIIISSIYSIEEDEEEIKYYIFFDLSDPYFKYENNSEKIENIVANSDKITLPETKLIKEGFYFNGWTSDFIYGHKPGSLLIMKQKNITLFPIFEDKNDTTYFRFEYVVEYNGEITDVSKELRPTIERANSLKSISNKSYMNKNATSKGWTDGTYNFTYTDYLVMPRRNVTLYAIFHNFRKFYYSHGDVDGIIGNPDAPFVYPEGSIIDLAESSRLSRKGYEIKGWHCEYDGKNYPIFYPYILPDADVVMTAIWEPIDYTILFITTVSSIPNIKIKAKTNDIIIVPNIDEKREGYIFAGWIIYETQYYKGGDEMIVEGQMHGIGISGKAIWIKK